MNKLIKGNLVMTNVADKDINMYVKAGWKLDCVKTQKVSNNKAKKTLKELSHTDTLNTISVENENNNNSDINEE